MSNVLQTVSRVSAQEFLPLFSRKYMKEVLGRNRFSRYMGTEDTDAIQYKLENKAEGESITFNFLRAIEGNGIAGNMRLDGTEIDPKREKMTLKWEYLREAIAVEKSSEKKSIVEIMPSIKDRLEEWSKRMIRYRIVDAMSMAAPDACMIAPLYVINPARQLPGYPAVVNPTRVATAAESTAYLTNNTDRVLFGLNDASYSTNFNTAMGNVSAATDGFTRKLLQKMHDRAKNASPFIDPLRYGDEDETYFVAFCDSTSFRQIQQDLENVNVHARSREGGGWSKNPIATGSDLEYDGVVIREIPDMKPVVLDAGAYRAMKDNDSAAIKATARGRIFMMGRQAIAIGLAQEPQFHSDATDYQFRKGVAIEEAYGCNKFQRQDLTTLTKFVDHGSVTAYSNATA